MALLSCPRPSQTVLRKAFVGSDLREIDPPAVVLDAAVVRRNCQYMLETVKALGLGFRAHIKTHKVGDDTHSVKLIVSTIAEAEFIEEYLLECRDHGKQVNVLYGIPPSSTCFPRLNRLRQLLGPDSISFMIDHPSQLPNLIDNDDMSISADPVPIYVKVNTGYPRAGLTPESDELATLLDVLAHCQRPSIKLLGFYSHLGTSYGVSTPDEALDALHTEIELAVRAADRTAGTRLAEARLTISVGATPTTAAAQNLVSAAAHRVKDLIKHVQQRYDLELHAGVYPVLDLQQLATHARPQRSATGTGGASMTSSDIGIRVLAEVLSVYKERGQPEALIGGGTLVFSKDTCKSYEGYGVVTPSLWSGDSGKASTYDEEGRTGWIVGRIAQEHGVLVWQGEREGMRELRIGERVLVWPNHACITGANFEWYLVVDSDVKGSSTSVVDVWARARGW